MDRPPPAGRRTRRIWLLTLILLIGAAARIAPLTDNRFHPDEALFATLGRLIITGDDPWLSETSLLVDKPPLFYYVLAGGISISWASELTARLPGLFASLISVALVARLGWLLWRSGAAALLAATFYALSPFAILFSPTVFADPQLVMWLLAALVAVASGRWGWGGLLYGLALATKQSALFFAPLVVGLGVVQGVVPGLRWRDAGRWAGRFGLGLALPLALMLLWDVRRGAAVSFWTAGVEFNNPGRLARSTEVWPRAWAWLGWLRYVAGAGFLSGLLAAGVAALVPVEIVARRRTRGAATTLLIAAFLIGYLAFHWLVAFPVLDRYLLPLVPLIALLVGRGGALLIGWPACEKPSLSAGWRALAVPGLALALAVPAWQAAHSAYPVGGDHGAFDGIEEVAGYLREKPLGTVVYYQSLGWPLHYYLYDAYLYLAPIGTPAALTDDLIAFGEDGAERYIVLAGWESPAEVLDAVRRAGYRAVPVLETANRFGERSFVVYRIERGGWQRAGD